MMQRKARWSEQLRLSLCPDFALPPPEAKLCQEIVCRQAAVKAEGRAAARPDEHIASADDSVNWRSYYYFASTKALKVLSVTLDTKVR